MMRTGALLALLTLAVGCGGPESSADGSSNGRDTAVPDDGGGTDGGAADSGSDSSPDGGTTDGGTTDGGATETVEPPLGATSGGSGGSDHPTGDSASAGTVTYQLLAPNGSSSAHAVPLLLVISGTEGSSAMMSNMRQVAPAYGMDDAVIAVLDGRTASASDGATVLDALRAAYDVDNDRTWLLSESAGTAAGLELALQLRQSWFAAAWFNDVNARSTPAQTAAELGVTPWANAGPGGDQPDADAIIDALDAAGYHLPADAPYSGHGADTHGSTQQFLAAAAFFADKTRAP